MYELTEVRFRTLEKAARRLLRSDFAPYLDLKYLFAQGDQDSRERFKSVYSRFYQLREPHITNDAREVSFHILFNWKVLDDKGQPRFRPILRRLAKEPDRKMHFSFVSKLVTMHQECSPPYDAHVGKFFSKRLPGTRLEPEVRIGRFIELIQEIKGSYQKWAEEERVMSILDGIKSRYPELQDCHNVRLMDFLVWKAGKEKLLHA